MTLLIWISTRVGSDTCAVCRTRTKHRQSSQPDWNQSSLLLCLW